MAIHLDFETRATVDVGDVGAYIYWRHPDTEILELNYAIDDEEVKRWEPGFAAIDNQIPYDLKFALSMGHRLWAHNANFEINGWNYKLVNEYGWPFVEIGRWRCSAVLAAMYSLPRKLEKVAQVLQLPEQKDMDGHRTMLQLTKPRNPSKNNPDPFFGDDERFEKLHEYGAQDVRVERAVHKFLKPINDNEWFNWFMDQKINERGIPLDVKAVKNAYDLTIQLKKLADKKIQKLTKGFVQSLTEVAKIKEWCANQGTEIASLSKDKIPDLLADKKLDKRVKKVITLRDENNKSSTAKLEKMLMCVSADGRVRDHQLFYGTHTGRVAGRLVQTTNIPKGELKYKQVVKAIKYIRKRDFERLIQFGNPLDTVSSCLRGFICAPKGREFICADYASIEARLVLWLAGEQEAVDSLMSGGDIYKELAAVIYKKKITEVTKEERNNGKFGILGAGYGMGRKRLQAHTKAKYNIWLPDSLAENIINAYRAKYWRVAGKRNSEGRLVKPGLWQNIEKAAIECVLHKKITKVKGIKADIRFKRKGRFLFIRLPSKRLLSYYLPRLVNGKYGNLQFTYMGISSQTHQWTKKYAWGGVLTGHIIQSMARDIMIYGMREVERTPKYDVLMNVYDEVLSECDKGAGDKQEYVKLLTTRDDWAQDCPIQIGDDDVWIGKRYRKG
jgi:DNA polymerase